MKPFLIVIILILTTIIGWSIYSTNQVIMCGKAISDSVKWQMPENNQSVGLNSPIIINTQPKNGIKLIGIGVKKSEDNNFQTLASTFVTPNKSFSGNYVILPSTASPKIEAEPQSELRKLRTATQAEVKSFKTSGSWEPNTKYEVSAGFTGGSCSVNRRQAKILFSFTTLQQ